MARVVATGLPHPVTQRGNRRQQTFFAAADYAEYRQLMAASCAGCGTEVWVYCLMPNHVHRVAVPANPDGLRCAIAEAHRRYTKSLSARQGWRGHPRQERFHSFVMDASHLLAAARTVENNPVRAGFCTSTEAWPWSSACAQVSGHNDELGTVAPMLARVADWPSYLQQPDQRDLASHSPRPHPDRAPLGL
jgi:putative transposase